MNNTTLQEYLEDKTLTSLQIAEGVLLGVTTLEDGLQQADSDTSNLIMGTPVVDVSEFTVSGSQVTTSDHTYDFSSIGIPEQDLF